MARRLTDTAEAPAEPGSAKTKANDRVVDNIPSHPPGARSERRLRFGLLMLGSAGTVGR